SSANLAQLGFPGFALAGRTYQRVQPCDPLLEVAIKPVVGFRPLQLLPKGSAVADGKVSWIVLSQDTHRAWYERRNDRCANGDRLADNIGPTLEVRREHQHLGAGQQFQGIFM